MVRQKCEDERHGIFLVDSFNFQVNYDIRHICKCDFLPKTANQPFDRLDCGHEPQSATDKAQKSFNLTIKLVIFVRRKLRAVLILALFAKEGGLERNKSCIQLAKVLKALEASCVQSLIALGGRNAMLPNQRLGVPSLLSLYVESRFRIGSHLRQLRSKRSRHCVDVQSSWLQKTRLLRKHWRGGFRSGKGPKSANADYFFLPRYPKAVYR